MMLPAEAHQERLLRRADKSADAAERAVRAVWRRILAAIQSGDSHPAVFHAARAALRSLPSVANEVLDDLGQVYRDAAAWSAASIARRMSPEQREQLIRTRTPLAEATGRFRELERLILPPLPADRIHAVVYQAGWVGRVTSLTALAEPDALAARIANGVQAGESVAKLAAEIRPLVQGVQSAARRVARTAGLWIAHEAEFATYEGLGDMIGGYQIHAVLDHATRPEHRKRDGRKYYREPKSGQEGFDRMPRPPREADGSWAFNCVLPGNVIQGRVQAVLKAGYSGEAIEIETANGARLTVTAQHPISTRDGFTAAGLLREGDQLLRYRPHLDQAVVDVHYDYPPVQIDQLFESLRKAGKLARRHCRDRFDLYGDAEFIEGDVDVVQADRRLLRNRFAERHQSAGEQALARAHIEPVVLPISRAHNASLAGLVASSSRVSDLRPLHSLGGCLIADRNPEPVKHSVQAERRASIGGNSAATDAELGGQHIERFSGDVPGHYLGRRFRAESGFEPSSLTRIGCASQLDTRLAEPATYGRALHPEFAAEMRERHSGLISLDEVRKIRRFHYAGPVFDMQTDTGYFTAGTHQSNIVIANCRCWLEPILEVD